MERTGLDRQKSCPECVLYRGRAASYCCYSHTEQYLLCRRFTSPTAIMERRKSSNYLGIVSRPSFGKFSSPSSSHKDHTRAKNHSKSLNHQVSPPSKHYQFTNHNRHISKMSTTKASPLKRPPQPHDDYAIRPFKKQSIENIESTGLELDSIIGGITPRATSPITTSEITRYFRRRKVISYAEKIRRKKAMVSSIQLLILFQRLTS